MLTIGIDPGQKGGIAILDDSGVCIAYTAMPETPRQIWQWIVDAMPHRRGQIVIERAQPMPKQGVVSVFTYGCHFGQFEMLAIALSLPYIEVRPQVWKKHIGVSADKYTSILMCERLHPEVNLVRKGCRKPHDGIAEAVLIGDYGRSLNDARREIQ